jgi:ribosomal protein S18 acetylase RimI-like enzyme
MSRIIIRELRQGDDLADLIALSHDFFHEYAEHHEFFALDEEKRPNPEGFLMRSIEDKRRATFVAIVDRRMVGYATVGVQDQALFWRVKCVGHISGLMVAEEHRRCGIGGMLLDAVREFFARHGATHYRVYTAAANEGAIDFYRRQGMEPLHVNMVGRVE